MLKKHPHILTMGLSSAVTEDIGKLTSVDQSVVLDSLHIGKDASAHESTEHGLYFGLADVFEQGSYGLLPHELVQRKSPDGSVENFFIFNHKVFQTAFIDKLETYFQNDIDKSDKDNPQPLIVVLDSRSTITLTSFWVIMALMLSRFKLDVVVFALADPEEISNTEDYANFFDIFNKIEDKNLRFIDKNTTAEFSNSFYSGFNKFVFLPCSITSLNDLFIKSLPTIQDMLSKQDPFRFSVLDVDDMDFGSRGFNIYNYTLLNIFIDKDYLLNEYEQMLFYYYIDFICDVRPTFSAIESIDYPSSIPPEWLLTIEDLYLNNITENKHISFEKEWVGRSNFIVDNLDQSIAKDWGESFAQLYARYKMVYDHAFRNEGVEIFYTITKARMEGISSFYIGRIYRFLWGSLKKGELGLQNINEFLSKAFDYYKQLESIITTENRQISADLTLADNAIKKIRNEWEDANRRHRRQIEEEYTWPEVCELFRHRFLLETKQKANIFAINFIRCIVPYYKNVLKIINEKKEYLQATVTEYRVRKNNQNLFNLLGGSYHNINLLKIQPDLVFLENAPMNPPISFYRSLSQILLAQWQKTIEENKGSVDQYLTFVDSPIWTGWLKNKLKDLSCHIWKQVEEDVSSVTYAMLTNSNYSDTRREAIRSFKKVLDRIEIGNREYWKYPVESKAQKFEYLCAVMPNEAAKNGIICQHFTAFYPVSTLARLKCTISEQDVFLSLLSKSNWQTGAFWQINNPKLFACQEAALQQESSTETIEIKIDINEKRELILLMILYGVIRFEDSDIICALSEVKGLSAVDVVVPTMTELVQVLANRDLDWIRKEWLPEKLANREPLDHKYIKPTLVAIKHNILGESDVGEQDWSVAGQYVVWARAAAMIKQKY